MKKDNDHLTKLPLCAVTHCMVSHGLHTSSSVLSGMGKQIGKTQVVLWSMRGKGDGGGTECRLLRDSCKGDKAEGMIQQKMQMHTFLFSRVFIKSNKKVTFIEGSWTRWSRLTASALFYHTQPACKLVTESLDTHMVFIIRSKPLPFQKPVKTGYKEFMFGWMQGKSDLLSNTAFGGLSIAPKVIALGSWDLPKLFGACLLPARTGSFSLLSELSAENSDVELHSPRLQNLFLWEPQINSCSLISTIKMFGSQWWCRNQSSKEVLNCMHFEGRER